MRALPRIALLLAAVLAICAVIWVSNRNRPLQTASTQIEVEHAPSPSAEPIIPDVPAKPEPVAPPSTVAHQSSTTPVPSASLEMKIDELLLAENIDETTKATRLLEMLPALPESLQEETAQHICNLMPDEAYGALGPLLTNGVAPEAVLDIVMADLLSRPNALKLPLLLNMARADQHPRSEEARSVLELHLEKDFGTDWTAWETSLQAWLKENPD